MLHGLVRKFPSLLLRRCRIPAVLALIGAGAATAAGAAAPEPLVRLASSHATVRAVDDGSVGSIVRSALLPDERAEIHRVHFILRVRNFAELEARVARGEVLEFAELEARYLPTRADWLEVAAWARDQGLDVAPADASRLVVAAHQTVAHLETALQTKFARVVSTADTDVTSAVQPPAIPARLQRLVAHVSGLQPHLQPLPSVHASTFPTLPGNSSPAFMLPQAVAAAYGATGLNLDGSGQRIAVVGQRDVSTTDLANFWRICGLPTTLDQFRTVDFPFTSIGGNDTAFSATFAIQWASAMAPRAEIIQLRTVNFPDYIAWLLAEASAGRHVRQLTVDYGLPEVLATAQANREAEHQLYTTLAAAGTTIVVATGDEGSRQLIENGTINRRGYFAHGTLGAWSPATLPVVTAVGGTSLRFNLGAGTGVVESVQEGGWTLPVVGADASNASAGGESRYYTRPAWQTGSAVPAGTMRLVPDVAAAADSNMYFYTEFRGNSLHAAGTDLASPIWGGLVALINQARAQRGLPALGQLGPRLYPLMGTSAFHPITTGMVRGSTVGASLSNGDYQVGPNYNLVTGLGSPNMPALVEALTMPEPQAPAPPAPTTPSNPTPTNPGTPAPTNGGGGGGGGSPSLLGALAFALALLARGRKRAAVSWQR